MKKVYIFLSIIGLISVLNQDALAQVPFGGYISTVGTANYPTHLDNLGKGGYRSVANIAERDAISTDRRKAGMLVYVSAGTAAEVGFYQLLGNADDLVPATLADPANWVKVLTNGTGTALSSYQIVADQAELFNIPTASRKEGMLVYVSDAISRGFYQLRDSDPGDLSDNGAWVKILTANTISGNGPPSVNQGFLGDFYIDVTNREIFGPKLATATPWSTFSPLGGAGSGTFVGNTPITLAVTGFSGVNPGTNDIGEWIKKVFYPAEAATAGLTVSPLPPYEVGSSPDITLTWTATRLGATTPPITKITVNGADQTFTSPANGASVSGTVGVLNVSAPETYTNVVTITPAGGTPTTVSAPASVYFQRKIYWGFVSGSADNANLSATISDATILGFTTTQEFATAAIGFDKNVVKDGTFQKLCIAVPNEFNSPPYSIWVGGSDQTNSFHKTTRQFINASGGSASYDIYTQKNNTNKGFGFKLLAP